MMTEQENQTSSEQEETQTMPEILPILPVIDVALFPRMVLPLVVHEDASRQLVDEAMAKDRLVGLVVSKTSDLPAAYEPENLYDVGTAGLIQHEHDAQVERLGEQLHGFVQRGRDPVDDSTAQRRPSRGRRRGTPNDDVGRVKPLGAARDQ